MIRKYRYENNPEKTVSGPIKCGSGVSADIHDRITKKPDAHTEAEKSEQNIEAGMTIVEQHDTPFDKEKGKGDKDGYCKRVDVNLPNASIRSQQDGTSFATSNSFPHRVLRTFGSPRGSRSAAQNRRASC